MRVRISRDEERQITDSRRKYIIRFGARIYAHNKEGV